ncbi:MAG: histidinol-phosphate transaminase [Synergistaceae bacterium]|nr:histidinol-phosphate transaminase [Synergistaceae bacterium]
MNKNAIDPTDLMRRDLRGMEPYRTAAPESPVKLDANESPFGLPERIRERLSEWLANGENLNRYPDGGSVRLREAIAAMWDVPPSCVTCGLGSDQLIDSICRVFLEPGDVIVTQSPTFSMYSISAALSHGTAHQVPMEGESSDARNLVRAVNGRRAKAVFICSPNNPTGGAMSPEDIRFVLDNVGCIVAVDEAYADFNDLTVIPLLGEYPNMIALRTFSKAFGLAGARVGYAIASEKIIGIMNLAKPPFNIPTISQLLAEWAIEEAADTYRSRVAYLKGQREEMRRELERVPWLEVGWSDANFLCVRSGRDIGTVLSENGISVKNLPRSGGLYCVRISVGTEKENRKAVDALCQERPR